MVRHDDCVCIVMKRNKIFALIMSALSVGCGSYGDHTRSDFSPLTEVEECDEKPEVIYLFTENENIDFNYTKVGLIEVQGGQFISLTEVMDELQYKAWNYCANGIMNISHSNALRETGTLWVENSERLYSSRVLTAVAVNIEVTDDFKEKYASNASSMDFIKRKREKQAKELKQSQEGTTVMILAGIVGLVVIIVAS